MSINGHGDTSRPPHLGLMHSALPDALVAAATPQPSQQFTRTDVDDGAVETLSIVRLEGQPGGIAIQVEAGTPDDPGDFVGIYALDGYLLAGPGTWELVPGDRLPAGPEATAVAEALARAARAACGEEVAATHYLAPDGSLPFAEIVEDWASGSSHIEAWPAAID